MPHDILKYALTNECLKRKFTLTAELVSLSVLYLVPVQQYQDYCKLSVCLFIQSKIKLSCLIDSSFLKKYLLVT